VPRQKQRKPTIILESQIVILNEPIDFLENLFSLQAVEETVHGTAIKTEFQNPLVL
jgi:hypothetical protein